MSRHTDIANGIFLLIAALFLLLYLVGSIVNNGNGKIKQQIKIPGEKTMTPAALFSYIGLVVSLAGYMITSGVALLNTKEEDDVKD